MENDKKEMKDISEKADKNPEVREIEIQHKIDIFDILKIVSPGTSLRIALDDILRAENGALIVVMNEKVSEILEGGFRVNCGFTPQRLTELSKMDGAVVLSEDLKKILYANVLMIPSPEIPTGETGTRHKAAERVAKQAGTLAIAVSERRKKITLYYSDINYVLRNAEEILRRATETLQILEKQREIYDDLLTNLNVLEVTGLVSISDVCNLLQRTEMINRVEDTIRKSIVELGRDGSIIKMRLKELTRGTEKTEQLILKDYVNNPERLRQLISDISFDDLLDTEGIAKLLFNRNSDESTHPRGHRVLSRTNLSEGDVNLILSNFKDLNSILGASANDFSKIFTSADFAASLQKELAVLRENIMVGKKI
ncbi:MAG: DNA integrity scanning diadenylate cyclase DisA [Nanoarchaeota archaeon]|nr:DNA integrity scanning diadenylate cyclase DisA [Nanoarchaeota archaeon]MBU4086058.1 DNA integrity scanning diadenylate cyclase DisA [Nanoarchaeota archaeon]